MDSGLLLMKLGCAALIKRAENIQPKKERLISEMQAGMGVVVIGLEGVVVVAWKITARLHTKSDGRFKKGPAAFGDFAATIFPDLIYNSEAWIFRKPTIYLCELIGWI